jgi:hypothetical protein
MTRQDHSQRRFQIEGHDRGYPTKFRDGASAAALFVEPVSAGPRVPYLSTWLDFVGGRIASYTWKLQVTTTLSQRCGLEMWGVPKTIGDIRFEREGERAAFALASEGRTAFRLSVRTAGTQQPKPVTSTVYSIFEASADVSQLTQCYRDTDYQFRGGQLELGDPPLADELRGLGLPKPALLATWNGHLNFSMTAPEKR